MLSQSIPCSTGTLSSAACRAQPFDPNLYQAYLMQIMPFTWHQLVQTACFFPPFKPILGAVLFLIQNSLKELLIFSRFLLPSNDPVALQGWMAGRPPSLLSESFGTHMDRETVLGCKVRLCHCDWPVMMGTLATCTPQIHMGTRASWNGNGN